MKLQTILFILMLLAALAVTAFNFLPQSIWQKAVVKPEPPVTVVDSLEQPTEPDIPAERAEPPLQPPQQRETTNAELLRRDRDLSPFTIEVSKSSYQLRLFQGDSLVTSYSVALGNERADKLAKEDPITPLGNFYIVSIENTSLRHPEEGPWFIRLHTGHFDTASGRAFSGIGIKGGAAPRELGKSLHTDCIIMQNKDIIDLKGHIQYDYKQVRLPVIIRP